MNILEWLANIAASDSARNRPRGLLDSPDEQAATGLLNSHPTSRRPEPEYQSLLPQSFAADIGYLQPLSYSNRRNDLLVPVVSRFMRAVIPQSKVQQFKAIAQNLVQNLSQNAFSQDQLDRMSDQIYLNIPDWDLKPLSSINPEQRPLVLNSTQYEIIQKQLNALTPDLRGPATEHFNRALQRGDLRCSNCGPRR